MTIFSVSAHFSVSVGAVLAAAFSAPPAFAHVSFVTGEAAAESSFAAILQVPHGCAGGLATSELRVKLPEGFIAAKPQPKAGWQIEILRGDYRKTYGSHGKEISSGPVEIRWKGGDLPDEFYDSFTIYGKISGIAAGTDLPFKVTQICGGKSEIAWDQLAAAGADPHGLDRPAPLIKVTAQSEDHAGHGTQAAAAGENGAAKAGALALSGGYVKAMLPGQPVGSGFLTIRNDGDADDRLISLESPLAGRIEMHEMAVIGDMMKMRKLDAGIVIAAGQTLDLKPGGLHLMFFKIAKPFIEGENVPVTLTFEKAGKVEMLLPAAAAHQHD